jgi:hypothetical protein
MLGLEAQPVTKIKKKKRVSPAFFLIVLPPKRGQVPVLLI